MEAIYKKIHADSGSTNYNKIRRLNLLNVLMQWKNFYKNENMAHVIIETSKKLIQEPKIHGQEPNVFGLMTCNKRLKLLNKDCNKNLTSLISENLDPNTILKNLKVDNKLQWTSEGKNDIQMLILNRPEIYKIPESELGSDPKTSKIHNMLNKVYNNKHFLYLITNTIIDGVTFFSIVDYNDVKLEQEQEPQPTLDNLHFVMNFFSPDDILTSSIIAKKEEKQIKFYYVTKDEEKQDEDEEEEKKHKLNSITYNEFIIKVNDGMDEIATLDGDKIIPHDVINYLNNRNSDLIEKYFFLSNDMNNKTFLNFDKLLNDFEPIINNDYFKEIILMQLVHLTCLDDIATRGGGSGKTSLNDVKNTMKKYKENIVSVHDNFHDISFDDYVKLLANDPSKELNLELTYIYLKKEVIKKTLNNSYVPSIDNIEEVVDEIDDYLRIYDPKNVNSGEEPYIINEGNRLLDHYSHIFDLYDDIINMSKKATPNKLQFNNDAIQTVDLDSYYNNVNFNNIMDHNYLPIKLNDPAPHSFGHAMLLPNNKRLQYGGERSQDFTTYLENNERKIQVMNNNIEMMNPNTHIKKYDYGDYIISRIDKYIENNKDYLSKLPETGQEPESFIIILYSYYYLLKRRIHDDIVFEHGILEKDALEPEPEPESIYGETFKKYKMTDKKTLADLTKFVIQDLYNNKDVSSFFKIDDNDSNEKKIKRLLTMLSTSGYNNYFICINKLCKDKITNINVAETLQKAFFIGKDNKADLDDCLTSCMIPNPENIYKSMHIEFDIDDKIIEVLKYIFLESANKKGLNLVELYDNILITDQNLQFITEAFLFKFLRNYTYVSSKNLHKKIFCLFDGTKIVKKYPESYDIKYTYELLTDESKLTLSGCDINNNFQSYMDCLEEMTSDQFKENVNYIGKQYLELFDNSIAKDFDVNTNPELTSDDYELRKRFKYDIYGKSIDVKDEDNINDEKTGSFEKLMYEYHPNSYKINLLIDEIIKLEKDDDKSHELPNKKQQLEKLKTEQIIEIKNDFDIYKEDKGGLIIKQTKEDEEFLLISKFKEEKSEELFNPSSDNYYKYNVSVSELDIIKDKIIERQKTITDFTYDYNELIIMGKFTQYLQNHPFNLFTNGLTKGVENTYAKPLIKCKFHTFEYYMDLKKNYSELIEVFRLMDVAYNNDTEKSIVDKLIDSAKKADNEKKEVNIYKILYTVINRKLKFLKYEQLIINETPERNKSFEVIEKLYNYIEENKGKKLSIEDQFRDAAKKAAVPGVVVDEAVNLIKKITGKKVDDTPFFSPGKIYFPYSEDDSLVDSYNNVNIYSFKEMYIDDNKQIDDVKTGTFKIDDKKGTTGNSDRSMIGGREETVTYLNEKYLTNHKNNLNLQLYTDISRLKRFRNTIGSDCNTTLGKFSYKYPKLESREEMEKFKFIKEDNIKEWGGHFITNYPYDKLHITDVNSMSKSKTEICKQISKNTSKSSMYFENSIINTNKKRLKDIGFQVEEEEKDDDISDFKKLLHDHNSKIKNIVEYNNKANNNLHLWNGLFNHSIFNVRQYSYDFLPLMIFWFIKPSITDPIIDTIIELNENLNKQGKGMRRKREKEKDYTHNEIITKNQYEYTCMFIEKLKDKLSDKLKNKLTDYNNEWLNEDVMDKISNIWVYMTEEKKDIYINNCVEIFRSGFNLLGKYILRYDKDADDDIMKTLVDVMITEAKAEVKAAENEKAAEAAAATVAEAARKEEATKEEEAVRLAEAAASAAAAEAAIVAKAARQETGLRRRIKSDNKNLPPPPLKTTLPYDKKNQGGGHYYFNPISRKRKVRSRSKTMKSR